MWSHREFGLPKCDGLGHLFWMRGHCAVSVDAYPASLDFWHAEILLAGVAHAPLSLSRRGRPTNSQGLARALTEFP